jgi:non-lysosomal glucosylceramidase
MFMSLTTESPGEIDIKRSFCTLALVVASASAALCQNQIPAAAWHIPIGASVANPGTQRPENNGSNIDDGYWQGAPVGGFGAGTFSRSYRGHFERWHVKAGTHKYQDVPANQFAVFAQPEGGAPVSMALAVGKPKGGALSSWNWSYPAGDGEWSSFLPFCPITTRKRATP